MKLDKLFSDNILVTPYKEDDDSPIIKPDTAEVEHKFYRVEHVGSEVENVSEGEIIIVNPQVVTRASIAELEGTEYIVLREGNALGTATDG